MSTSSSSPSSHLISSGNSDSPFIGTDLLYGNVGCEVEPGDKNACDHQGNMNSASLISLNSYQSQNFSSISGHGTKRLSSTGNPFQNEDHVTAERKRREKLNERFIALSALIPGLKKSDKASLLGEAVKYLKQLQERVKKLEELTTKRSVESVIFVKRYKLSDSDASSSDQWSDPFSEQPLPEIEARVLNKDVLIRIHCEKRQQFAVKIVTEIQKLHFTVINSSIMPFGDYIMAITIVAQMDDNLCATAKDIVELVGELFYSSCITKN